jgi:excisionase family DNA binding protein
VTDLLPLPEVAERLGVHYMTAYRYVRTGRLAAVKDGGQWMVDPKALDRFEGDERTATPRRRSSRATATRLEARMLAGDRLGAWSVVEAALAAGASPSEVEVDALAPAMRSIGERWHAGELGIGDEHQATVVAQHVLSVLSSRFVRRGRRRGTVIIGAAPGEDHQLPVTIAADHLRAAGFEVIDFGANTPADAFAAAARDALPVAVIVGATVPGRQAAIRRVVRAVRAAAPSVAVLVGGAGVPEEAGKDLGADGWTGPDATAIVAAVEQLPRRRGASASHPRAGHAS